MISVLDWPIASIYLILILFIGWYWAKRYKPREQKVFFWGLVAHLLGGLAFAFIYEFYYGGGDTFYYFSGGQKFIGVLFENPEAYFQLLFSNYKSVSVDLSYHVRGIQYFRSNELWLMVRITSVFTFFGLGQFLSTTILFSVVGFVANWLIYRSFSVFVYHKYLFLVMFLPSVIFWGNGIMKDTVVFLAVGVSFYTFSKAVNKNIRKRSNWYFLIFISIYLMFLTLTLKPYVVGVFTLCFIIAFYQFAYRIFNDFILRVLFSVVSIAVIIGLFYFLQQTVLSSMQETQKEVVNTLKGFHSWHAERGGSTYSLGEIDYTFLGILSKTPSALVVTFFRPYLWEVSSPFMLLTFVESVFFIFLFGYTLYYSFFKKVNALIWLKNPLFLFSLLFVLIFGFLVGLTTYNFGALARYKLICLPFYVGLLLILTSKLNFKK